MIVIISIGDFLSLYYGIKLNTEREYSHKQLKKRFKFLQTCSFRYTISNANLVKNVGISIPIKKILYVIMKQLLKN